MKKNKLLMIMLGVLIAITLVGVIALVIIIKSDESGAEGKEPSADELVKVSMEVPEITTNLADNGFIKIKFMIQANDKDAKIELEKRNFQVQNIIIAELSELKASDFKGKKGQENLQEKLKTRINSIMQTGSVEKVYITSSIIQ
ncbi:flagellar basal body-associated protein FliL [Bacillus massiliigorillae]|uniref:flagellar basal body-associated protein FliL n=1 Tax=Bacillus massiliigorillae TaxID=1243664 RepID=UPI0003A87004|nr:flagellar basal body-associated protein FliL [Bacillus massiliigorillae]